MIAFWVRGLFYWQFFTQHMNLIRWNFPLVWEYKIWQIITTKLRTCHDSCAVLTCENICDLMTVNFNKNFYFHQNWITSKKISSEIRGAQKICLVTSTACVFAEISSLYRVLWLCQHRIWAALMYRSTLSLWIQDCQGPCGCYITQLWGSATEYRV